MAKTLNPPKIDWREAVPTKEGWYLYREHEQANPEVVHVYPCSTEAGAYPRYTWTSHDPEAPLMLAKRAHESVAGEAAALRGLYLVELGKADPVPIEIPPLVTAQQRQRKRQIEERNRTLQKQRTETAAKEKAREEKQDPPEDEAPAKDLDPKAGGEKEAGAS